MVKAVVLAPLVCPTPGEKTLFAPLRLLALVLPGVMVTFGAALWATAKVIVAIKALAPAGLVPVVMVIWPAASVPKIETVAPVPAPADECIVRVSNTRGSK